MLQTALDATEAGSKLDTVALRMIAKEITADKPEKVAETPVVEIDLKPAKPEKRSKPQTAPKQPVEAVFTGFPDEAVEYYSTKLLTDEQEKAIDAAFEGTPDVNVKVDPRFIVGSTDSLLVDREPIMMKDAVVVLPNGKEIPVKPGERLSAHYKNGEVVDVTVIPEIDALTELTDSELAAKAADALIDLGDYNDLAVKLYDLSTKLAKEKEAKAESDSFLDNLDADVRRYLAGDTTVDGNWAWVAVTYLARVKNA
jgi:hypothetical protein